MIFEYVSCMEICKHMCDPLNGYIPLLIGRGLETQDLN